MSGFSLQNIEWYMGVWRISFWGFNISELGERVGEGVEYEIIADRQATKYY